MTREIEFYVAKAASEAGCYNDFIESIRRARVTNADLSVKERDILFKGYQKVVEKLSEEQAYFSSMEQQILNAEYLDMITRYRTKVEAEFSAICNGFIELIDSYLLPAAGDAEAVVFYKRMKGEQYFYMAEAKAGEERQLLAEKSRTEYEEALQTATAEITSANVERLHLESSRSLLYYKIFNEEQRARNWAKLAAKNAIDEFRFESSDDPAFTALLDLIIFGTGGNCGFFEEKLRKISEGYVQEGQEKPERRKSL